MFSICLSVISIIIAIVSLVSSIRARIYQKTKDNKLLRPQLLLESQKKQTTDYIGIDFEIDGYEKLKDYNVLLKFFNNTDAKIIDLSVSVKVLRNETFFYLLDKALEEKDNNFYCETDEFGNIVYTWDKIFGMPETTNVQQSILEGGNSFEIELPGIFSALLLGAMYSYRMDFKKANSVIEFEVDISYNHALTKKNKYVKIKEIIPVTITFNNMIQGPYVLYDSFIFKQL